MKRLDEIVGTVEGVNGTKGEFEFHLTLREVKHVRRCLRHYCHIHPPIKKGDTLQSDLLKKFLMFGKRKGRQGAGLKKKLRERSKYVCNVEGCNVRNNLIADHIIPLSEGGADSINNLQWLCKKHNEEKNLMWRIAIKEKELDVLRNELNILRRSK